MTAKAKAPRQAEVFAEMTRQFIERIEAGAAGDWSKPWLDVGMGLPRNAVTGKAYRGGNVLVGLMTASIRGFEGQWWATYKQWDGLDAQVRKGEKGTRMVFWKFVKRQREGSDREETIPFANSFTVFHSDQVEGWEPPVVELPTPGERNQQAEQFFAEVGAEVRQGGDRAYYAPVQDYIGIPEFAQFADPVAYYATFAHEHAHWTGHETRLSRDLKNRFGSEAYAMEELVAELAASFTCAALGLTATPRPDHAAYLAHWLGVLRADPKALWTAASKAQEAHDFLVKQAGDAAPELALNDLPSAEAVDDETTVAA
jgi:antirestriction protein ArdC